MRATASELAFMLSPVVSILMMHPDANDAMSIVPLELRDRPTQAAPRLEGSLADCTLPR